MDLKPFLRISFLYSNHPQTVGYTLCIKTCNTDVVDRGSYLLMGSLVPSFRKTSTSAGVVFCRNYVTTDASSDEKESDYIEMGEGTSVHISINSNKVVSDDLARCGGNEIYYAHVVKLNNGKILSTFVEKFSKLPLK